MARTLRMGNDLRGASLLILYILWHKCQWIGTKSCELDNVFPPDDPWFGLDSEHESYCYMWLVFGCLTDGGEDVLWWSGGCFTNVSRALQDILLKFVYCRNCCSFENFKLKLWTCAQSMALGTRTKFQHEILTINVISSIVYFCEIILESSQNVSETTPCPFRVWVVLYWMSGVIINYEMIYVWDTVANLYTSQWCFCPRSFFSNKWIVMLLCASFISNVTYWTKYNQQGAVSIRKTVLPGMAIPMLKIRRPNGRLIFNMEIAIRR